MNAGREKGRETDRKTEIHTEKQRERDEGAGRWRTERDKGDRDSETEHRDRTEGPAFTQTQG
jgi:hypothetical protein